MAKRWKSHLIALRAPFLALVRGLGPKFILGPPWGRCKHLGRSQDQQWYLELMSTQPWSTLWTTHILRAASEPFEIERQL